MSSQSPCALCVEFATGRLPAALNGHPRVNWIGTSWCLLPSLGPVGPRHLLLVPREHVNCSLHVRDALNLVGELRTACQQTLASDGRKALLFEHANSSTGCGVTHAHVHVVAVPSHIAAHDLFADLTAQSVPSLAPLAREHRELFWFADDGGVWAAIDLSMRSQWARRVVARANATTFDPDWKAYTHAPWFDASRVLALDVAAVLRVRSRPAQGHRRDFQPYPGRIDDWIPSPAPHGPITTGAEVGAEIAVSRPARRDLPAREVRVGRAGGTGDE
jgi:hypothetical protein